MQAARHARTVARLSREQRSIGDVVADIGLEAAYLAIPRSSVDSSDLPRGEEVVLSLEPAPGVTLDLRYDVMWADPEGIDHRGEPAYWVGLRLTEPDADRHREVELFIDSFRETVLLVDDEAPNIDLFTRALGSKHRLFQASDGQEALGILHSSEIAVLVTDQRMPEMTGTELLAAAGRELPEAATQKVVITAYPDLDDLQHFINEGRLLRYLTKPVRMPALVQAVREALAAYRQRVENDFLRAELRRANWELELENVSLRRQVIGIQEFDTIIGESAALREVLDVARMVAESDSSVLLLGETGTGKELLARAIHAVSGRSEGPFVAVNCAALPETLLESELFGHEKGAFTGASQRVQGRFERASGGTLFLDEIGDVPLSVQVKLLRAIQEGTIERVGGRSPIKVDIRLVTATHRDLEGMIRDGTFRADLYYRINVVPLRLPPLRERPEDIWPLAVNYLREFQDRVGKAGIELSEAARRTLEEYDWPGNVRELVNVVERIVALTPSHSPAVMPALGSPERRSIAPPPVAEAPSYEGTLKDIIERFERRVIEDVLGELDGHRTQTATRLGISRQALTQKLKKHGIT